MKIVIDIPEEFYGVCKEWVADECANIEQTIIAEGTPLPKGHGRLIDADLLLNHSDGGDWNGGWFDTEYVRVKYIYNAPTIIEADKGEEE